MEVSDKFPPGEAGTKPLFSIDEVDILYGVTPLIHPGRASFFLWTIKTLSGDFSHIDTRFPNLSQTY